MVASDPPSPVSSQSSTSLPTRANTNGGPQVSPAQPSPNSHVVPSQNRNPAPVAPTQAQQSTPATNGGPPRPTVMPLQNRKKSSVTSKDYLNRLQHAFSPSRHDVKEYDIVPPDTARPYIHRQQRGRLWRRSWAEWLITLLLCIGYFLILYLFQRDQAIDRKHRRILNALVTGTVLLLGVNLNNSLRSYVKMIRWQFLAAGYRPLKEFDLIMNCENIVSVLALVRHGRRKDNKFPLNSKVQVFALFWLTVQLAIAVAVGSIGLFYNLDISHSFVNTQTGDTSSINLTTLVTDNHLFDLASLNTWGQRGLALSAAPSACLERGCAPEGSYLSDGKGLSRRFFVDYNPDQYYVNVVSDRYIDSSVVCKNYRVIRGELGELDYYTYLDDDGREINQTLFESPGSSGLYVTVDEDSNCGARCGVVVLFQAQSSDEDPLLLPVDIGYAQRFVCNNTVSDVMMSPTSSAPPVYRISASLSRMLAGMLGWSENPPQGSVQYNVYQELSQTGWFGDPSVEDVQSLISSWTIGGVAAMDANDGSTIASGLPRMIVSDGAQPIEAQVLVVRWWWTGSFLVAIPAMQLATLILVIAFANKVIIKDDSPIALAKTYHSLLNKIGDDHGCMLTGDQLMETLQTKHHVGKVVYGYQEGASGLKHVDIFESGVKTERAFPTGDYDGISDGHRACQRRINAHELF